MKKIFLAVGLMTLINPSFAQHNHGQEYNKSVFRDFNAKRNKEAINQTNKDAHAAFPDWSITVDKASGLIKDIYGPAISLPGNTNPERSQACMSKQMSKLHVDAAEWTMYRNLQNDKGGWVDYAQVINNHKVAFSRLGFRFTADGKLIRIQMKNYGAPQNYTAPVLSAAEALTLAKQDMGSATITNSATKSDWEWFPVPAANGYELHPSWAFTIEGTDSHREPIQLRGYVDAIDGSVLYRVNDVKFDYDITVKAGVKVTGILGPVTVEPLSHLKLQVNDSIRYTDNLGFFSEQALTIPDLTTINLAGKYAVVKDVPSNSIPSMQENVILPGHIFNYPTTGVAQTRHLNAYYHVNVVHDYMKSHYPTFTGLDIALTTNVDIATSTCNAFYNGNSINFYASGGGCNSFAEIGDIVYHEYGHGINDKFYDQFGPSMDNGGLNEGYADVWAMSITDNPILGANAGQMGSIRRYDLAPKVFPEDLTGEVHADGEIIAGAWWDVRENLGNVDTMANIFAQTLFDTPDGPDGTEGEVYHACLISALLADDDDNNINNGTPHFMAIVEGFAEHGIFLLSDAALDHLEMWNSIEYYDAPISADLQITYQPFLKDVQLKYRVRPSTTWTTVTMTEGTNLHFTAQIPGQAHGSIVDYYFVVRDTLDNPNAYFPIGYNPTPGFTNQSNIPYQYGVELIAQHNENFENSIPGWTVGNFAGGIAQFQTADNATAGKWIHAVPIGSSNAGQLSQTDRDHTWANGKCLVTGNAFSSTSGVGAADVDGGKTTVLTPVFDITNFEEPIIEYYRWYSNNRGSNPGTETWEVRIGAPTASIWGLVEYTSASDQSWRRRIFRVRDYTNANEIQMGFVANDNTTNGGCVVEAAVDDFVIYSRGWPTTAGGVATTQKASIFPNPSDETLNIALGDNNYESGSIGIYDLTGKKINEIALEKNRAAYIINTKEIASGTYFLIVKTDRMIQSQKVVISH